jgi:hypothetical protein
MRLEEKEEEDGGLKQARSCTEGKHGNQTRDTWVAGQGGGEGCGKELPSQQPMAAAADGRTHDQMATTNAAQGQPPQTFLAGGTRGSRAGVHLDPFEGHLKIFVGGLSQSVDDVGLCAYFETYGTVLDAHVKTDQLTKRSRGGG